MALGLNTSTTRVRVGVSAIVVAGFTVLGVLLMLGGLFTAVTAASTGISTVPVQLTAAAPAVSTPAMPCVQGASTLDSCEPAVTANVWPPNEALPSVQTDGDMKLFLQVDAVTALPAGAPSSLGLLLSGVVLLLLVPVFRSTAAGRPFTRGNARRLGVAGAVTAGGWLVGHGMVVVAAGRAIALFVNIPLALHAGTFYVPEGWLAAESVPTSLWPMVVAVLLAALAAVFRAGGRLAADAEGLV